MNNEIYIPTIGGQSNVISMSSESLSQGREYSANISQVGTAHPTINAELINTFNGNFQWFRDAVGKYRLFSNDSFFADFSNSMIYSWVNPNGTFDLGQNLLGYGYLIVNFQDAQNIEVASYDGIGGGAKTDGLITSAIISIREVVNLTSDEDTFNAILGQLDTIQLSLWTKIIVRAGDVVTEVDGAKYRKTNNFANSSKVINS